MTIDYDYSIEKINKRGDKVLSNQLYKGEKLVNGNTYADELERLGREPESSPFAQSSLTEHNNPENPSAALTLSEDGINTRREGDHDPELRGVADFEPEKIAKASKDGNSTVVVDAKEN
jgi:hypothetical protein